MLRLSAGAALLAVLTTASGQAAVGAPSTAAFVLSSVDGSAAATAVGDCRGGTDDAWRSPVTATGAVIGSPLPEGSTFAFTADVHREIRRGASPSDVGFVPAGEGWASIQTTRGAVRLDLSAGSCAAPALTFTPAAGGARARGNGAWAVTGATGALTGLRGNGTLRLDAVVGPSTGSPAELRLDGILDVDPPDLRVASVRAYWSDLVDYALRRPTVDVELVNAGAYAYAVTLDVAAAGGRPMGSPRAREDVLVPGARVVRGFRFQMEPGACTVTSCAVVLDTLAGSDDVLGRAQAPVAATTTTFPPTMPV